VLMHVCSCVLMYLCAYVLMCEYINMSISKYVCVPMCSTKLSTALSPSKFYHFFGRKRSGITPFFKTSKHLFQRRFHLSVSPDCKMCVRVTNTGLVQKRRVKILILCFILARVVVIFVKNILWKMSLHLLMRK